MRMRKTRPIGASQSIVRTTTCKPDNSNLSWMIARSSQAGCLARLNGDLLCLRQKENAMHKTIIERTVSMLVDRDICI